MKEAQQIGQRAHERDAAKHDVKLGAARVVGIGLVWRRDRDARDADHDRRHRDVLVSSRGLSKHALAREHQHEQARRKRRLHDDEGHEFEREHLQRPAKHREPGAKEPAPSTQQPRGEREPQMRVRGRLLGIHRLEGDAYAVEDRGANRREQPKDEMDHDRR
jgi:hypothetical protein